MNRPRNRQPRREPPAATAGGGGRRPTAAQVVPGAAVFVVLKQDQRSGRETAGTVREVLTRGGGHPRGIKVRLGDGRVGRVQRMGAGGLAASGLAASGLAASPRGASSRGASPRTAAAPTERRRAAAEAEAEVEAEAEGEEGVVCCPVCGAFEGDEAAVTHHVEREHFG